MTTAKNLSHPTLARVATLAVALVVGMLLLAAPASAKYTHHFETSFGEEAFSRVGALAVDNSAGPSAGDVYVGGLSSPGPSVVDKFDEDGNSTGVEITGAETPQGSFGLFNFETFEASRGVAVDGSAGANAGDVYVADLEHGVLDRFDEAGKFLCQITGKVPSTTAEKEAECAGAAGSAIGAGGFSPTAVAVNPVNGDVYVSDASHAVVDEFNPAGEYVGQISDSHVTQPGSIAFNSTGELYVDNGSLFEGGNVVEFDAGGAFAAEIDNNADGSVAVDASNDHVYAYRNEGEGGQIAEFDAEGHPLATFGAEQNALFGVVGARAPPRHV
jgi:hypothetical protein